MHSSWIGAALVASSILIPGARSLAAPILYFVDSTGDGSNLGPPTACDDGTGHCTLRAAMEAASVNPGADSISISIDPTTDPNCDATTGHCTIGLATKLPDISEDLEIDGPGANLLTVQRNAGFPFTIFNVTTIGTASFSGLTIRFGEGDPGDGSGIRNRSTGTVNVSKCVLSENSANSGGGIGNGPGTLNVSDSTITRNTGRLTEGAGGILNNGGTVNVTRCTISENTGDVGGGIKNDDGTVTVLDSTISDNHTVAGGGGIANRSNLIVKNSTISGNDADSGGGLSTSGTASLTNCTIAGNLGTPGGGISNGGTLSITNSTITGNQVRRDAGSTDLGGGIHNNRTGSVLVSNCTIVRNPTGGGLSNGGDNASVTVKSSVIAQNGFGDVFGVIASEGFNLSGDGFGGFDQPTDLTGEIFGSPLDPMLDPNGLQDNGGPTRTVALLCGSPAIDQGSRIGLNGPLTGDQRGFPRTVDDPSVSNVAGGDGTDIGALETGTGCGDCDITCPGDIDRDAEPDHCDATVDYPAPTVSSSVCPATCSIPRGSDFPVGKTTVTCHTTVKECSFHVTVHDTQKPTVTAPPAVTAPDTPGSCSASVDPGTAIGEDNCPGVTVAGVRSDGQPLNALYPVGTTTITWTATDASTNTSVPPALQTITVVDNEPPKLDAVTASPSVLWPPNHAMRDVTVSYTGSDNCPASACRLSVVSSEPDNGLGDGDTAPDWLVKDDHHVQLRAERSGLGDGRTYTTTVSCSDAHGNSTSKSVDVKVSHDMDGPADGSMFATGALVSFAGRFRDGAQSAHTGEWLFDSVRKPATIVAADRSNPWRVTASTSFNSIGVYRVQMNVTDSSGQTGSTSMAGGLDANLVIYPSNGEYAAGSGWINFPAGAYAAKPTLTGKGSFGFVSRSARTATKASGETEFDLHLPGFRFNAVAFESQTVTGAKAQFRGTGTVNGVGSYGFVMTTIDGDLAGGIPDRFRIRIWNKVTGAPVYDNEMGSRDDADPITTVGAGSSIVIHK